MREALPGKIIILCVAMKNNQRKRLIQINLIIA